ncbi:MAG: hypothetical protein AVDCRST_MAG69-2509, partial [uncultured Solirubrobacteraceae bacterium]
EQHAPRAAAGLRRRRVPGGREGGDHGQCEDQPDHQQQEQPQLAAGVGTDVEGHAIDAQRLLRERPGDRRRRAQCRRAEGERAAQAQRGDREPEGEPDQERDQGAARV